MKVCKVPDEINIYDEKWSTDFTKHTGMGLLTFMECCFWWIFEAAAEDPAHLDQLVIRIMHHV
jgi:hypothetical protein